MNDGCPRFKLKLVCEGRYVGRPYQQVRIICVLQHVVVDMDQMQV